MLWARSRFILVLTAIVLMGAAIPSSTGFAVGAKPVCPGPVAQGFGRCHVWIFRPQATSGPTGLSPAKVRAAYGFTGVDTAGSGQTIAIVDAYDDPTAESDLAVFSSQFGLPACTTANGCFKKVNQTGETANYPAKNAGWALEISLDVQWAHAIAPGAKILLVEANSASLSNLLAAEDYASAHADYVSNSWGASEFSGETAYDSHFAKAGVSYFVSAGDTGLPAEYPSSSRNVISVGGTTLSFNGSGQFSGETGWSSGGGGCSLYETAPSAQSGFGGYGQAGCAGKRATPDVSLVADPASGVSVYDSTKYNGQSGWFVLGGTSASAPMWAARSAVSGARVNSAYVYGGNIAFRDIVSGNNGAECASGFDLCTGRGSWIDPARTQRLLNGGFNTYTGASLIPDAWTASLFSASDGKDTAVIKEGSASVRIAGQSGKTKKLEQHITLSGTAGDGLVFSFWVKSKSVPSAGSCYGRLLLYNGTTVVAKRTLNCPTGSTSGFNSRSVFLTAPASYDSMTVRFVYSKSSGRVWFDAASLLK